MGARTRADLSDLLILFRIERGKEAFRRVGCIELRCDVSGAYVITVPCTVRSAIRGNCGYDALEWADAPRISISDS